MALQFGKRDNEPSRPLGSGGMATPRNTAYGQSQTPSSNSAVSVPETEVKPATTANASATPEGGSKGQFHAEQHFEYVRPLRAGERLTATTYGGRTWSKQGRSGTLRFGEIVTDFRDVAGDLVVRTRKVGVRIEETPDG